MFKHILIPTDGSKLATKGVKAGVKLAKALGARVTGVYVIQPYFPPMYGEAARGTPRPRRKKRLPQWKGKLAPRACAASRSS